MRPAFPESRGSSVCGSLEAYRFASGYSDQAERRTDFFVAGFFAAELFTAGFFAADFFATVFLATVFFVAAAAFFATDLSGARFAGAGCRAALVSAGEVFFAFTAADLPGRLAVIAALISESSSSMLKEVADGRRRSSP